MKVTYKFLLVFLIILSANTGFAQCSGQIQIASAGTWDNLRNTKDSLKFKTTEIIEQATKNKSSANFSINSTPNKFLTNYSDKEYCEQKLQQTSGDKRLVYDSAKLNSAEEVSKWISGFSQGSSTEGKKLYDTCDKSCSPIYEYKVSFENNTYKIKALVTCGHARDKGDNKYKLKAICS